MERIIIDKAIQRVLEEKVGAGNAMTVFNAATQPLYSAAIKVTGKR